MTFGLVSNLRVKLTVIADDRQSADQPDAIALLGPIAHYTVCAIGKMVELVKWNQRSYAVSVTLLP